MQQLASRVRKARRDGGVCPTCQRGIRMGELIGKVGSRWHHVACLTGRQTRPGFAENLA